MSKELETILSGQLSDGAKLAILTIKYLELQNKMMEYQSQLKILPHNVDWYNASLDENMPLLGFLENSEVELSVRTVNCLKAINSWGASRFPNINTLGDLLKASRRHLLSTPNFGRKTLNELDDELTRLGLLRDKRSEY